MPSPRAVAEIRHARRVFPEVIARVPRMLFEFRRRARAHFPRYNIRASHLASLSFDGAWRIRFVSHRRCSIVRLHKPVAYSFRIEDESSSERCESMKFFRSFRIGNSVVNIDYLQHFGMHIKNGADPLTIQLDVRKIEDFQYKKNTQSMLN